MKGIIKRGSSRFTGVSKYRASGKWIANIKVKGRVLHLGYYGFQADAAIAHNTHVAWLGLDRPLNVIPLEDYQHDLGTIL